MSNTFLDEIINMTAGESFAGAETPEMTQEAIMETFAESTQLFAEAVADNCTFDGELIVNAMMVSGEAVGDTVEQAKALGYRMKGSAKKVLNAIIKFFKSMITWVTGVDGDLKGLSNKAKETLKRLDKATGVVKGDDKEFTYIEYDFAAMVGLLDNQETDAEKDVQKVTSLADVSGAKTALDGFKAVKDKAKDVIDDIRSDMKDVVAGTGTDIKIGANTHKVSGGEKDVSNTEIRAKVRSLLTTITGPSVKVNTKLAKNYEKAVKLVEKLEKEINQDKAGDAAVNTIKVSCISNILTLLGHERQGLHVIYQGTKTAILKTITLGEKIASAHTKA
ncbi:MAG: hypothetical protein ACRCX2_34295 [Paraclostridium sp.]